MPEMITITRDELSHLEERARKLATDKSYLQLVIRLMNRVSDASGLEDTVHRILYNIMDVVGGTNIIIYYLADREIHYEDVLGRKTRLDRIEDEVVRQVFDSHEVAEFEHDFSATRMETPEFSKAYTWVYPLMVGPEFIGVIKMESLHLRMREMYKHLPAFFHFVALALKNEIAGHSRLTQAYTALEQEVVERKRAEAELRIANETLEEKVAHRTHELLKTNEQLRGAEQQVKLLLEDSEKSRQALLITLEEEKRAEVALRESADEIQDLYNHAPCGYHSLDASGTFVRINDTELSWLGYSWEEIVGRMGFVDLVTPQSRAIFDRAFSGFSECGFINDLDIELVRKDGTVLPVALNATGIRDAHGGFVMSRAVLLDVTERKRTAGLLHQREQEFRTLVENSPDIIARYDRDCRRIYVNPMFLKIAERTSDELLGSSPEQMSPLSETSAASLQNLIRQVIDSGIAGEMDLSMQIRDNTRIWFSVHVVPEYDSTGQVCSVMSISRDITERKRAEAALEESERSFRTLAEALPQIVWATRADGWNIYFNQRWMDYTGMTLEESYGHGWLTPFHPDDQKRAWQAWQEATRHDEIYSLEVRLRRADGAYRWWLVRGVPLRDATGQIIKWFGTCTDIHDLKVAEGEVHKLNIELEQRVQARTRELAESEKRFRSIYDTAPVSIWQEDWSEVITAVENLQAIGVTDFAGYFREHPEFVTQALCAVKILDVNQWTLDMVAARDQAELLASLETVFATPDVRSGFIGQLTALAQGQTVHRTEMEMNTMHGDIIHGLLAITFPPRGSGSGDVLMSMIDITERKRAEENIHKLNEELQQRAMLLEASNKELESFSYSISHDLRTPLRSIDGFSRILLEDCADKLDDEDRKNLRTICAASQRMAQLIDDILQLSRITRTQIRLLPVDLSALAATVANDLARVEPGRSVECTIEPGCVALADGNLIRIVLENLIGNAWKFTGKQPAARIRFGRETHDGTPVYFVRDNGAGFDMQYASKLFGSFQRLHSESEFPGTGIGLASVQRIIHRHGGKVWIESRINEGTTVYFTLTPPGKNIMNATP